MIRVGIYINKEDHFELHYITGENTNIREELEKAESLVKKMEAELGFVQDPKLGYLLTKPQYVGLGLSLKVNLRIPEENVQNFQMNLPNCEKIPFFDKLQITPNPSTPNSYTIKLKNRSGIPYSCLASLIEAVLEQLFQGIVDKTHGYKMSIIKTDGKIEIPLFTEFPHEIVQGINFPEHFVSYCKAWVYFLLNFWQFACIF